MTSIGTRGPFVQLTSTDLRNHQIMERTHRSIFLKELKNLFPMLKDEINQEGGLLHCEMHVFASYIQNAIDSGEERIVQMGFRLATKHLNEGNKHLSNAVGVSFLENLNFRDEKCYRSWALDLMPASLKEAYMSLN